MIKILFPVQLSILKKDLKIWRKVINILYPKDKITYEEPFTDDNFEKLLKKEMKVKK